jgi:uncharacterized protein (TIGR00297 family)
MSEFIFLFPEIFALVILAILAYKFSAIDLAGLLCGVVVGLLTILGGGPGWFIIVVVFFVLSAVLTRYKYAKKEQIGFAQAKGGMRSWPNILANAGVGAAAAVCEFAFHGDIFGAFFAGSMATAAADTLATEVGLTSATRPRLITHLRRLVAPGISGGVTLIGETTALGSALLIALLAFLVKIGTSGTFALGVFLAGIIGANLDSVIGATIQGKNTCVICKKDTESLVHHGAKTAKRSGFRFINNNVVNFIATLSGGIVCALLVIFLT